MNPSPSPKWLFLQDFFSKGKSANVSCCPAHSENDKVRQRPQHDSPAAWPSPASPADGPVLPQSVPPPREKLDACTLYFNLTQLANLFVQVQRVLRNGNGKKNQVQYIH